MGIQHVVYANGDTPALREGVMHIDVQLAETAAVDLARQCRSARAVRRMGEVLGRRGIHARTGRQWVVAEIAVFQASRPTSKILQIQRNRAALGWRIRDVFS